MSLAKKLASRYAAPAQKPAAPTAPQKPATPPAGEIPEAVAQYIAEMEAHNAELQAQVQKERERGLGRDREVEKLRNALDAEKGQTRAERIRSYAMNAAAKHDAHDPEELADLVRSRLTVTEKGDVVDATDPTKAGEETVKAYLDSKPHHRKSKAVQGSGAPSTPGTGAPPAKATTPTGTGTPDQNFKANLQAAKEKQQAAKN